MSRTTNLTGPLLATSLAVGMAAASIAGCASCPSQGATGGASNEGPTELAPRTAPGVAP